MIPHRQIVSILLVTAIAGGGFLYAYEGNVRVLPLLLVTVGIQASVLEATPVPFDLGDHCRFSSFTDWGGLETRDDIPAEAVAALFLTVVSWPAGVGFLGAEPRIVYMTAPLYEFPSRAYPRRPLFTLELQDGQFHVPPGFLLQPGDSAQHNATYTWSEEGLSVPITEKFTFASLGLTRLRKLPAAFCA